MGAWEEGEVGGGGEWEARGRLNVPTGLFGVEAVVIEAI